MAPEAKRQLKKKHKVSHFHFYFFQGMEVRTYFVYFRTQTQSPTNSHRVWVACGLTEQNERYFLLQVTSNSEYGFLFTWNGLRWIQTSQWFSWAECHIYSLKNHPYFYHRHSLLKWDDVKIAE